MKATYVATMVLFTAALLMISVGGCDSGSKSSGSSSSQYTGGGDLCHYVWNLRETRIICFFDGSHTSVSIPAMNHYNYKTSTVKTVRVVVHDPSADNTGSSHIGTFSIAPGGTLRIN